MVFSSPAPSLTVKAYWPVGMLLSTTVSEVEVRPVPRVWKVFRELGGVPLLSSIVTGPLAPDHFSSKGWP